LLSRAGAAARCARIRPPSRDHPRRQPRRARGIEPLNNDFPNALGDRRLRLGGIDRDTALRLLGREPAIGVAQGLVEGARFRLEAVRHALAAALLRARKAHLRRHVENESEIRLEVADSDPLKSADETRIEMAELALIDSGRIDEAVADHP